MTTRVRLGLATKQGKGSWREGWTKNPEVGRQENAKQVNPAPETQERAVVRRQAGRKLLRWSGFLRPTPSGASSRAVEPGGDGAHRAACRLVQSPSLSVSETCPRLMARRLGLKEAVGSSPAPGSAHTHPHQQRETREKERGERASETERGGRGEKTGR